MIEKLAHILLKAFGQMHLVPFVRGLIHIGRSGAVSFPKELLGQGANIVLSGLNNTMAFQSNPDWIWPWWHERQKDSTSPGFVPTGMNLVTSNITLRNWASLGVSGGTSEAMVDPVGMITLGEQGWSAFPYLRAHGAAWFPPRLKPDQVQQVLQEKSLPVVETRYLVDSSIFWTHTCEVVSCGSENFVLMVHEVENRSATELRCTLGVSLRPYNVLNISHIHRIKYQDQLWRINRRAAMWLLENPDRLATSDRNGPDPVFLFDEPELRSRQSSRSGVAAGACEWDLQLNPWERKRIVTVATLRNQPLDPFSHSAKPTYEALGLARDVNREQWKNQLTQGASMMVPEKRWMNAWDALRLRLPVFDDGDRFTPGTFLYHKFWIRDSAFLALCHTGMGLHETVEKKIPLLRKSQNRSGYFCSQEGEWDSNGQAIWMIVEHAIAAGNLEVLERNWSALKNGAEWIISQSKATLHPRSPHSGLMPAGFSAEHFGPNDHYYWDSIWSLQGLLDAERAAELLGHNDSAVLFQDAAGKLKHNLQQSIQGAFARVNYQGLPSSPYRKVDSSAIGSLVAISPLDIFSVETPWIRATVDSLCNQSVEQGMFFQKIVHTGLNAYLSIQLARAMLIIGDPRWKEIFESVLDHASSTWTWPEAIHPRTGGGCMGDGDHGWAVAEVLAFMTMVLVRIQGGKLFLGHGLPDSWYTPHMNVSVSGACTRFGTVSWQLKGNGDTAILTWKIERNRLQKKVTTYFALPLPFGFNAPRLTTFFQGHHVIMLDTDTGEIEIPIAIRRS